MKTQWENIETHERGPRKLDPTARETGLAAGSNANPRALEGQRIGAYRITKFLDSGGMGEIYLAERDDGMFHRQVAIKLIRADLNPKEYERMQRETRLLASLQHPNLVMLFDAGRLPDGRPYLVMEYVPGSNLRAWLNQRGAFPPPLLLEITRQACAGLQAAHAKGVIHRDIKPENIIVSEAGGQLTVKVLDFGIAVRPDATSAINSQAEIIGTFFYMPPEQINGVPRQQLTPATDLYALGLTVFEMITGQVAIQGRTVNELISQHLVQPPPLPGQLFPHLRLPPTVDGIFARVLAKNPAQRFQQANDFAQALQEAYFVRSGQTVPVAAEPTAPAPTSRTVREKTAVPTAPTVVDSQSPGPSPAPPLPTPAPTPPGPKRAFSYVWLGLLVVGLVAVAAAYWAWQRMDNLDVRFTVQNAAKQPLPDSVCELLELDKNTTDEKPGVALCSQTTGTDGTASCSGKRITPGKYWLRARHAGYRDFEQAVQLAESRKEPGTVRLVLTLEK